MNKLKIKTGVLTQEYENLISDLYKKYPNITTVKISEFKKSFFIGNPFFKHGKVKNYFLFDNGKVVGHIAAIIDTRSGTNGLVGFFECSDNALYAEVLFKRATGFLKRNKKTKCIGPINMSTWQNFRVSYTEKNPPFFLEPFTLEYYRDLFLKNGFSVEHKNITTSESVESTKIRGYGVSYRKSIKSGYHYELLNVDNALENINNIYHLTNKLFVDSYSFYKISKEEFIYFANEYIKMPGPHYIFILKNSNMQPVGFLFGMFDLFNPRLKQVAIKTMGVLSEYRGLGLGNAMLYYTYKKVIKDGFKKIIFSTMSVDNERVRLITGKKLKPYRKYEVFGKKI